MAEAVGLTASIIAISTAAAAALKISAALYNLAGDFKEASEDIEAFALDTRTFGAVVELGQFVLKGHQRKYPRSPVLEYMTAQNLLHQLAEQAKRANFQIENAWRKTESMQSKVKIVAKLKWILRKNHVKELHPKMESVKASLSLVINTIRMEAIQERATLRGDLGSTQYLEEIAELKHEIQLHLDTIKFLEENNKKQRPKTVEALKGGPSVTTFEDLETGVHRTLSYLGESMIRNEAVPNVPPRQVQEESIRFIPFTSSGNDGSGHSREGYLSSQAAMPEPWDQRTCRPSCELCRREREILRDPRVTKEGEKPIDTRVISRQPSRESQLRANGRAGKSSQKERKSRRGGQSQKESGNFVDVEKLEISGGFEEAEKVRKAKDRRIRRELWESQNGTTQVHASTGAKYLDDSIVERNIKPTVHTFPESLVKTSISQGGDGNKKDAPPEKKTYVDPKRVDIAAGQENQPQKDTAKVDNVEHIHEKKGKGRRQPLMPKQPQSHVNSSRKPPEDPMEAVAQTSTTTKARREEGKREVGEKNESTNENPKTDDSQVLPKDKGKQRAQLKNEKTKTRRPRRSFEIPAAKILNPETDDIQVLPRDESKERAQLKNEQIKAEKPEQSFEEDPAEKLLSPRSRELLPAPLPKGLNPLNFRLSKSATSISGSLETLGPIPWSLLYSRNFPNNMITGVLASRLDLPFDIRRAKRENSLAPNKSSRAKLESWEMVIVEFNWAVLGEKLAGEDSDKNHETYKITCGFWKGHDWRNADGKFVFATFLC